MSPVHVRFLVLRYSSLVVIQDRSVIDVVGKSKTRTQALRKEVAPPYVL